MKNISVFTIILLGLGCTERVTIDPLYKENIVIQATLTNKEEYFEVFIDKTIPPRSRFNTIKGGKKPQRPPSKNYKIRLYQGKDKNTKALMKDLSGLEMKFEEKFSGDQHSSGIVKKVYHLPSEDRIEKVYLYYKSSRKIKAEPEHYYWLEVEYDEKTYVTDKQWMQSALKVNKNGKGLYREKHPKITYEDNPKERNFYILEYYSIDSEGQRSYPTRHEGSASDVLNDGNKKAFLVFTEIDFSTKYNDEYSYKLIISCANYATYRFLNLVRAQDRENGRYAKESSSNPLFSTPPASLNGNIYEKESKSPTIGNFNVKSVYSTNVTSKELGYKK